jgi:hypothetical protein
MEDPGFENNGSDFDSRKSLHPVQRGVVKDWEALETLWQFMLEDIGIVSCDNTSVLDKLACDIIISLCMSLPV